RMPRYAAAAVAVTIAAATASTKRIFVQGSGKPYLSYPSRSVDDTPNANRKAICFHWRSQNCFRRIQTRCDLRSVAKNGRHESRISTAVKHREDRKRRF